MKVFIVLLAIFACAASDSWSGDYGGHYAAPIVSKVVNLNSGQSWQYRKQDGWGNYAFGYNEQHNDAWGSGGSSRDEKGDSWGNKEGSYSLNVGDGRQRIVKYVADGAGFRASIKTNEPGIVASNPAAVDINTPYGHASALVAEPIAVATKVGGYADAGLAGYSDAGLAGYGAYKK